MTTTTRFYCPTLSLYLNSKFRVTQDRMACVTEEQLKLLDDVYRYAEANYERGGHWVVEAMTPWEVLKQFENVQMCEDYMALMNERAADILNA